MPNYNQDAYWIKKPCECGFRGSHGGETYTLELPGRIQLLDCGQCFLNWSQGVWTVQVIQVDLKEPSVNTESSEQNPRNHTLSTPKSLRLFSIPSKMFCLDMQPGLRAGALVWITNLFGAPF